MSVTALKTLWASVALYNSSYTSHTNTLEITNLRSGKLLFDEGFNTSATNKEKAWLTTAVDMQ